MDNLIKSIDVKAPLRTVYNQWIQFENFPQFMEGVEEVTKLDDKRLRWVVNIGGKRREWYAEITEQIPDQRIAWCSEEGTTNAGVVMFYPLDANNTRVSILIDYAPKDMMETVSDAIGIIPHRGKVDLERFKNFIEKNGHGTIENSSISESEERL